MLGMRLRGAARRRRRRRLLIIITIIIVAVRCVRSPATATRWSATAAATASKQAIAKSLAPFLANLAHVDPRLLMHALPTA